VRQHPSIVYARERARRSRLTWRRFLLKFVVFALVPTAPLFNVHQSIAYGGTLGQYYLQGPRAYLTTFAIYWGTVTLYLICYASVWRGLAEGSALGAAWLAPARAGRVRQVAEWACAALYYGGVPLLLLWRFLA
jgi:apolipoprotein N-acyltransferase